MGGSDAISRCPLTESDGLRPMSIRNCFRRAVRLILLTLPPMTTAATTISMSMLLWSTNHDRQITKVAGPCGRPSAVEVNDHPPRDAVDVRRPLGNQPTLMNVDPGGEKQNHGRPTENGDRAAVSPMQNQTLRPRRIAMSKPGRRKKRRVVQNQSRSRTFLRRKKNAAA